MRIDLVWDKPLRLRDGLRSNLIYECRDLESVSDNPGVYVFARCFGDVVVSLYIGQALRLHARIEQQLNNVRLMMGLKRAPVGHRILLPGRLKMRQGQKPKKILDVVETALIKRALANGHDLLNRWGTKTKVHAIRSKGNTASRQVVPLMMLVER